MDCRVESVTIDRLQTYIDKYGQAEGLRKFLQEKVNPNPLTFEGLVADKEMFGVKFLYEYNLDSATARANGIKEAIGNRFVTISESKDTRGRQMWKIIVTNPIAVTEDELAGVSSEDPFEVLSKYLGSQRRSKFKRLSTLDAEISVLKKNGKDVKGKEAIRTRLLGDIANLETQIEQFQDGKDADSLKRIAFNQLAWVSSILAKEEISASEINEINYVIDLWDNARSILYDDAEDVPEDIMEALSDIKTRLNSEDLFGNWWKVAGAYLADRAGYSSSTALFEEYYKISDLKLMNNLGLDLSRTGNKLLSDVESIMRDAVNRSETEYAQSAKKLHEVFVNLKAKGKEDLFRSLLQQLDSNGKWTGSMTNIYSQDWYDASRQARKKRFAEIEIARKAGNTKAVAAAYRKYRNWVRDNSEDIDIRFFIQDGFTVSGFTKESYIEYLENQFGTARTEEIIEQALEQYDKYKEALQAIEQVNNDAVEVGLLSREEADKRIDEWVKTNDPVIWMNQGDPYEKGETREYTQKFNPYKINKPKVKLADGKLTGWYDARYSQIENDADLLEAYNFVRDYLNEMMSYIPAYLKKDHNIHAGFIPRIKKEILAAITMKDMLGTTATLKEDWIASITSPDGLDHRHIDIDPLTGLPYKNIPTAFLTELPVDERSTDIEKVLAAFSKMAIAYKWKSSVEDTALLTNRFLSNISVSEKRKQNTPDDLKAMKQLLEYTEDVLLYNKTRADEGASKLKIYEGKTYIADDDVLENVNARYKVLVSEGTTSDVILNILKSEYGDKVQIVSSRRKAKILEEKAEVIEEKLYNNEITEEEYAKLIAPLEEEAKGLGRNLVWSKVGDKLLRYNQAMALGFNPFSAINNYAFGITSNIIWAAGKTDFTPKQCWQAFGLLWASVLNLNNRKMDKIANLIIKFNILSETVEYTSDGKNETLEKIKNLPFILLKSGDYFIKGQTFIAMMLNKKITDINGVERSLFEAFDNEGNWKSDEFGESVDWNGDVTNKEELKEFFGFKNYATQLIKKLHGNFDPKSPARYKKYILGRMLGQFRFSWMIEGFAQRFETKKFDKYLNRDIEGRYATMGRVGFTKSLKVLARMALFQSDALRGIKAQDRAIVQENMRRNLTEIYMYAVIMSVFLALKAGLDDEDDKARLIAMNLLTRVMADTTFYLSPGTFTSIVQDPFPIIKVYTRANTAFKSAGQLLFNEDLTEHETEQKWTNLTNAFPYINQYNRFKYLSEKVRTY